MKKTLFFFGVLCCALLSCTKDQTDYKNEASEPEESEFGEAVAIKTDGYNISIAAMGGTFRKGYNEIRLNITDGQTNRRANASAVTFLPVRTDADGEKTSCPHRYDLPSAEDEGYFSGYSVFTDESGPAGSWELYIGFTVAGKKHTAKQAISVREQPNKNLGMAAFTGKDGKQYCLALISPKKPLVGENELLAGVYRYDPPTVPPTGDFPDPARFSFAKADGLTLRLDPRMPDPSMGNHSSPNNKDLTQGDDGLYHGRANYTMSGNWTLNFILTDPNGAILYGTEVPKHHTPGKEGAKSELHIDVLL